MKTWLKFAMKRMIEMEVVMAALAAYELFKGDSIFGVVLIVIFAAMLGYVDQLIGD